MRHIVRIVASIQTIGWGVFCASSWTWCIGMFLPIVMLGRYGVPGFLAFAIPNVIGCTAFGYIVSRKSRSETLQRSHGRAMQAFSLITLAYHVFFLSFISLLLFGVEQRGMTVAFLLPLVLYLLAFVGGNLPTRTWPIAATLAYAVSITLFVRIGVDPLRDLPMRGSQPDTALYWLAPTLVFGFLLCPYLDLTFHRALRESPSRHAFAVFGVTFAVMIVLTCAYRELALDHLLPLLVAHFVVQALFTMAAHMRELRSPQVTDAPPAQREWLLLLLPMLALPIAALGFFAADAIALGEKNYLRFLVFYGLVFPAYALLFMNPWRPLPRARGTFAAAGVVILLALPLYELGFIQHQTSLLLPPLLVLCLLPLLLGRIDRRGTTNE